MALLASDQTKVEGVLLWVSVKPLEYRDRAEKPARLHVPEATFGLALDVFSKAEELEAFVFEALHVVTARLACNRMHLKNN